MNNIIIAGRPWGPPRIKMGGATSDNEARSQHGAMGQLPPQIFSLPPPPTALVYPLEILFAFIYSVK